MPVVPARHAQDEKALLLLKTVDRERRLFWALEAIDISFSLALMVAMATGNAKAVNSDGSNVCGSGHHPTISCYVFAWRFLVFLSPIAVTVASFLLSSAVARPTFFSHSSLQGRSFDLVVFIWINYYVAIASVIHQRVIYVDVVLMACASLCAMVHTIYNYNRGKNILIQTWTDARKVPWHFARWVLIARTLWLVCVYNW